MRIIVVGCGRVGAELAYRLYKRGHQVTVIDQISRAFDNLPPDFRGHTVEGEALAQDVLRRAGIEHAEALAAVTNSDALNAVVAHIACCVYNTPNVVARNYDPHRLPLIEAFGLQTVSSASWGAQRIEEMIYSAVPRAVFSAGNGEVEVYEFRLPDAWAGRTLRDLIPGDSWQPVALTRAGRAMMPTADTRLEVGDLVHVSATFDGIQALNDRLRPVQEA